MLEARTYRKKPVEIRAMHFGGYLDAQEIVEWVAGDAYAENTDDGLGPVAVFIPTLEGVMRADVGDFIIQGVQDEFYPCKPDIFRATYDTVL